MEDAIEKPTICGVIYDRVSESDVVARLTPAQVQSRQSLSIVACNAEKVVRAGDDAAVKAALENADIVIPDGIGISLASWLLGDGWCVKLAGVDLMHRLLGLANERHWRLFVLGGTSDVATLVQERLKSAYPNIIVAECRNGYFPLESENKIASDIAQADADLVLLALGSPRQELFLDRYRHALKSGVVQCVGGSMDVFAGTVDRAPRVFIELGLEWLYRLLRQPRRLLRQRALPVFVYRVGRAVVARATHRSHTG